MDPFITDSNQWIRSSIDARMDSHAKCRSQYTIPPKYGRRLVRCIDFVHETRPKLVVWRMKAMTWRARPVASHPKPSSANSSSSIAQDKGSFISHRTILQLALIGKGAAVELVAEMVKATQ